MMNGLDCRLLPHCDHVDFCIYLSGGECYEYKWFSSVNPTRPYSWCQRSDGLNVTGKDRRG